MLRNCSLAIALLALGSVAQAEIILPTFTNTSSSGNHTDFGGTRAVVSDSFFEDHRGIAEFSLAGLQPFTSATLEVDVFDVSGPGLMIDLVAFHGDNVYSIGGDWSIASFATITSLNSATLVDGQHLSINISSALASAVANGDIALGLRFQRNGAPTDLSNLADFRNLRIVTQAAEVPEPASLAIWGIGSLGMAWCANRRARKRLGPMQ